MNYIFFILEKKNWYDTKKDLWNFLETLPQLVHKSQTESAKAFNLSIENIEKISNPSQKARAWIRKALMEKVLCDFLKVLYFHSDNAAYDFDLFIYLFIYFSLGDD